MVMDIVIVLEVAKVFATSLCKIEAHYRPHTHLSRIIS